MNSVAGKFVLSGASGMLGMAMREALIAGNAEVLQLVRRSPQTGEIRWDPLSNRRFADASLLEGFTAAIHLSGANLSERRWSQAYKREMIESRVNSTLTLAKTLAGLRQPPKALLVASATGIYGDRGDELLDEASDAGSGFLAEVCTKWEAAAEPAVKAGIRVVHLRFGVVVARGAGALARMESVFRWGLGGRLGSGNQWMSWIGLPDLVEAVLFTLTTPTVIGALNVTSPYPVTNAEFTRALAWQLHRPALLPAPAFALRLAFGQMADQALLSSCRAIPKKLLEAGFRFRQPRVEQTLGSLIP